VMDESQPSLLGIGSPRRPTGAQVLPHSSWRNPDPEFQFQLVGNSLLAPGDVVSCHSSAPLPKILWQPWSSRRLGLLAPEEPESFALPTDERIWLDIHQRIAPLEHSPQGRHRPASRIVGPPRFDLTLLEERELFAEKEILSSQGLVGTDREGSKLGQVKRDQRYKPE